MQKVSKENSNHCVSGGFIFDHMDRLAHDYLCNEYGKDKFYFTKDAKIVFAKQVCNWDDVELRIGDLVKRTFYPVLTPVEYTIQVLALSKVTKDTIYANAVFTFVEKDHAYCDTKGGVK